MQVVENLPMRVMIIFFEFGTLLCCTIAVATLQKCRIVIKGPFNGIGLYLMLTNVSESEPRNLEDLLSSHAKGQPI